VVAAECLDANEADWAWEPAGRRGAPALRFIEPAGEEAEAARYSA
jgi:hypothetical protein